MAAAVDAATELSYVGSAGVHKQQANRLLEPFSWHTVVITGTDWRNFFALRTPPDAQPEFQRVARLMLAAYRESVPQQLTDEQWHLPFVRPDERATYGNDEQYWRKVSAGRCARVSYLTHDGRRDPDKDIDLHDMLRASGHMSPFEHVVRPMTQEELAAGGRSGNFGGWVQYRKQLDNEWDYSTLLAERTRADDELLQAVLELSA
jgi:hypothetical protein